MNAALSVLAVLLSVLVLLVSISLPVTGNGDIDIDSTIDYYTPEKIDTVNIAAAVNNYTPYCGIAAVNRGSEWVTAKLPYCQSSNGQRDPTCGGICRRPSNPLWDKYRSDCSGLVSYSWGISAPGASTRSLSSYSTNLMNTTLLQPGDAIIKIGIHTMLFKEWIIPNQRAVFIEESRCGAVAKEATANTVFSNNGKTITLNGYGTFTAIRQNGC